MTTLTDTPLMLDGAGTIAELERIERDLGHDLWTPWALRGGVQRWGCARRTPARQRCPADLERDLETGAVSGSARDRVCVGGD
jgi:hypothetical protein